MPLTEINFDGIVGPSHNYSGLSLGNLAATSHAGNVSYPKAAAMQGLYKMRHNLGLGLAQGFLLPLLRPNNNFFNSLNANSDTDSRLTSAAWSASAMWVANAATVSPAADTGDGLCHLTPANLVTMPHRAQERPDTARQLAVVFSDKAHFRLHAPVPSSFGDEGAANHMRLCCNHSASGLELFVYGRAGGPFPARQHEQASRAIARGHLLDPDAVLFIEQNPTAIAAGAFHNDVVAVANENVLFVHELAFADPDTTYAAIRDKMPEAEIVVVPDAVVSLAEAIRSYLFNAQLVTLPSGEMALIVPLEAWQMPSVRTFLDTLLAGNGAIRQVLPVDVRESMSNGGGPACLRLRVVADPATVDPRFMLSNAMADRIEAIIKTHWPDQIDPQDLGQDRLTKQVVSARLTLLEALNLSELA
jgi:succinylarginine dihydrolase